MTRPRALAAGLALALCVAATQAEQDQKKWDVAAPTGGSPTPLAFDTTEGTWMNVDVSPDGRQIVFDLLGDLYMMPIDGIGAAGHAHHERSGVRHAAALQPRRQAHRVQRAIATASGTSGRSNTGGKDAKQISSEKPLVREQPDLVAGRRIHLRAPALRQGALARRRRDLDVPRSAARRRPAGHRAHGWQKDTGEPDVSPDGRLPLLQQGRHPGQTFEYNKDPNGTIYAIMRRDLRPAASAARSACRADRSRRRCRPTARRSPRPPRQTARAVSTCATSRAGAIASSSATSTRICRRLGDPRRCTRSTRGRPTAVDRDLGRREDLARGRRQRKGQPDSVHRDGSSRRSTTRCDFRRRFTPDEFPVRMLRDVRVSPDGTHGRLQRARPALRQRALPDGEPRRLDAADSAQARAAAATSFEFFPSFSRDGQWIVYTTWTDAEMGASA